jgi:Arc/MetJ family transcription regulator
MAGAAASMTGGNATANVTIGTTARRLNAIAGDDSRSTGSSTKSDMVHIGLRSYLKTGAKTAGITSIARNATATNRRSGVRGSSVSAKAAPLGRVKARTKITGAAA